LYRRRIEELVKQKDWGLVKPKDKGFFKPSLLREGAERSEAEGFFPQRLRRGDNKSSAFSLCRGEAAKKNPSVSGQKNVRSQLPLAREPFMLCIFIKISRVFKAVPAKVSSAPIS